MPISAALLPLVLTQQSGLPAVERFEFFLRKTPAFSVDLDVTIDGVDEKGKGSFLMAKNRFLFTLKAGKVDYTYASGPWGSIELERSTRKYVEYRRMPFPAVPDSILSSSFTQGLPEILLAPKAQMALPEQGKNAKLIGKSSVNGVTADQVEVAVSSPMGNLKFDLWIATDGRLLRYLVEFNTPSKTSKTDTVFTNWKQLASVPDARFKPQIPSGFVPVRFTADPPPIVIGDPLQEISLKGTDGKLRTFAQLKGTRGLLIVAARPDCVPSQRLLTAFKAELAALPAKGVNVTMLGFDGRKIPGWPTYTASAQHIEERLGVPGTPFLILVDASGRVAWLHYGFDSKDPNGAREVLRNLSPLKP